MGTMNDQGVDVGLRLETERAIRDSVEHYAASLLDVSHRIHRQPELRFEERFASALLTEMLQKEGFRVEIGVADLPTAFIAEFVSEADGPTVAFVLEYDALETIGHGCGHNVIASMGLGAALGTKRWMEQEGRHFGRILVVGSPGEEGGGGKNHLIAAGLLDGIDAALMMHPSGENLSVMRTLGRVAVDFEFSGRAAHAAVSPHLGINALDAAVLTLNAIGLLRQQLSTDSRVHAVILDGGEAPNIIPERSLVRAYIRAEDTRTLVDELQPKVENCARGAALATGATVSITIQSPTYAALAPNATLGALIEKNFERVGRITEPARAEVFPGSTDMGNVSQIVPAIHPNIEFVPGLGMHTQEAAALAAGKPGDEAVLDGALIMAMTAAQLFTTPELMDQVRESFTEGVRIAL
jgi:amidohydrolase